MRKGKGIMTGQNKRQTGSEKEIAAATFLEEKGLRILEHNYRKRQGEIDLIATDGTFLIFVEVKFRSSLKCADPLAAVTEKKQRQISKISDFYRMEKHIPNDFPVRYDVIGICGEQITWIKNAFWHKGM